ncbi:hypothetical protein ACFL2V_06775 [Pseudomonadota bacterium]
MPRLSLRKTEVPDESASEARALLSGMSNLSPDTLEIAIKLLGDSVPFNEFMRFVQESEDPNAARIIDVGEEFRRNYASTKESSDDPAPNWMSHLLSEHPTIVAENTDGKMRPIQEGWHAIHSPEKQRYPELEKHGLLMFCARRPIATGFASEGQFKVLSTFYPDIADKYRNVRETSNRLESRTNLRHGRINIFLSGGALKQFEGIALHKSMAFGASDNELIVFPMHSRFLFVCRTVDLQEWLKTNQAREAYDDKLRIQGHKFPATPKDLQTVDTKALPSLDGFWSWKADAVRSGKIPLEALPQAYLGKVEKTLGAIAPHLSWRNDAILGALQVKQRLAKLMEELE